MAQYLPGRINIVFRPEVDLIAAIESLKSAGITLDTAHDIDDALMPFPQLDAAQVRMQVRVELYEEDEWVERIKALEEVEICARTMQNIPMAKPGEPQRQ